MADEKVIKYSIISHVADLGDLTKDWTKEVNIMTWGNSKNPVIDIRKWNRKDENHPIPGKGVSLAYDEFTELTNINLQEMKHFFNSETVKSKEE